jgi:hypothetical protein
MSTARWTKYRLSVPTTSDSTTNLAPERLASLGWRQELGRSVLVRVAVSISASVFPSDRPDGSGQ